MSHNTKEKKELQLLLPPEVAYSDQKLRAELSSKIDLKIHGYHVGRRSIDARSKQVKVNLKVVYYPIEEKHESMISYRPDILPMVNNQKPVLIIGAGPAGLFAALRAIELGFKPIVIERGKDVQSRRKDLADINKKGIVNPDSNYCFGEGGAGTYSDGKLYTRSKKRGDLNKVLEMLVAHGAVNDIMIDAHPHIGTNKLPKIIAAMRHTILDHGGEVRFDSKVTDFLLNGDEIKGVEINGHDKVESKSVILATGHSARDIFELLASKKIEIEAKPFALGVRIEHQQNLIDKIQYHCENRGEFLPAASYSLVHQVGYKDVKRGVFSFCMCPGGFVVPAATAPGEVVVNGMSPSRRNSSYANSGIVVAVENEDMKSYANHGVLMNLAFQREIEQRAWNLGGKTQSAPAQRLIDFINKKSSNTLLPTSYQPGLTPVEMREVLPPIISERLVSAFKVFGKKMKGYLTNDAQIIGVESRTSSPVKIPRDSTSLEHPQIKGLFPCGEGGGYAGGIVSAAIDGMRCAEMATVSYARK